MCDIIMLSKGISRMSDRPSERRLLAERIAKLINDNHLNRPFGGDVEQSQDKGRPYNILFSVPRLLDGLVRVYGPKFILVQMEGPLARGASDMVFESEQNALDFLRLAFVEHKQEAAYAIPVKARK